MSWWRSTSPTAQPERLAGPIGSTPQATPAPSQPAPRPTQPSPETSPPSPPPSQPPPETAHHQVAADPVDASVPRTRWHAIWAARWIVLAAAVLAAGLAVAASRVIPARYSAAAVVRVTLPLSAGLSEQSVQAANSLASQYTQVATAGPIIEKAAATLGAAGRGLTGAVSASTVSSENLVQISARASSPGSAVNRANAMAAAFAEYLNAENTKVAAESAKSSAKQLSRVQARLQSVGLKLDTELARREAGQALTLAQRAQLNALQTEVASLSSLQQSLLSKETAPGTPTLKLFSPAGAASKTQPRPVLYALVAFIVVLLIGAQLASFVAANRATAR